MDPLHCPSDSLHLSKESLLLPISYKIKYSFESRIEITLTESFASSRNHDLIGTRDAGEL